MNKLQRLIFTPRILYSAAKVSLVVGTLLNIINQWEYMMAGQGLMMGHLLMNYLVPFCVSTYSGAKALATTKSECVTNHTATQAETVNLEANSTYD
ncbi:MAG: hypothetical protein PHO76_03110 [Methylotenera sp.]|nr:hypothetical protein [Methylotenera sp.]MDD4926873.1 hypothetical protein [Methylotenera sp.]